MKKLTLVSFLYNGCRVSKFLNLPMIDGKAVLPAWKKNEILRDVPRGVTITIG